METEKTAVVVKTNAPLTEMDSGLYRKNVMRTLSVKPAKLGLSLVSRNTELATICHCVDGIFTETGEFFLAMRPYLLGEQLAKIDKFGPDGPQIELGDLGFYLQALARTLKVKAFSSKKKVKLGGTLTARILDLMEFASTLADIKKKLYYGPKMIGVEKEVRNPATNETAMKMVLVVDKTAEVLVWEARKASMAALLPKLMELHSELCLAILGTPTGPVNLANIKKLVLRFPEGTFDMEATVKKDPVAEAQVAQEPKAVAAHV